MAKRKRTQYQRVYWIEVGRTGGREEQTDKSFIIAYMKDGKLHEERVGRERKDGVTAKKAQLLRLKKIEGEEQTKREIREERTAMTWTFAALFEEYRQSAIARGVKAIAQDVGRYNKYLKDALGSGPAGRRATKAHAGEESFRRNNSKYLRAADPLVWFCKGIDF